MYYNNEIELEIADYITEVDVIYNVYYLRDGIIQFGRISNIDELIHHYGLRERPENDFGPLCIQACFNNRIKKIHDKR